VRRRVQISLLTMSVVLGLIITGCSGKKTEKTQATPITKPSSGSPSPPVYESARLKSSLLPPADIGAKVRRQRTGLPALGDRSVPTCADKGVELSKAQWVSVRQFSDTRSPYGTRYARYVGTFSDPASTEREFEKIRTAAKKCPAKGHVAAKQLAGNQNQPGYDYMWTTTEDSLSGWSRLRALYKKTIAGAGKSDTLSFVTDYLTYGNALVVSIYWERLPPGGSESSVDKKATEVLTKQLQKIG
jgi:hypothetical protein